MWRIVTSVTVTSCKDYEKSFRCDALVDTGATFLVLPAAWKDRLGDLNVMRTVQLETATQEIVSGEVCGPVVIQLEGFDPINSEVLFLEMTPTDGVYDPLVGYLVLEQSLAAVDMVRHQLMHAKTADLKTVRRNDDED
jgi:predicted aspartyl protease